jgi:hypothetical protein
MYNIIFSKFEKILGLILLVMISIVAGAAVVELGYILFRDMTSGTGFLIDINELFDIFLLERVIFIYIILLEVKSNKMLFGVNFIGKNKYRYYE